MLDAGLPAFVALSSPPSGTAPSPWIQFLPFLLVLGIFYFVILMPMRKRQQKVQSFLAGLKAGDKVITSGGIYGTLTRVDEDKPSVQIQVANNLRLEVSKAAIVGYQGQDPVVTEGNQS